MKSPDAGITRGKRPCCAARHTVDARDLLNTPWTEATLRPFFADRPVAEWFNTAAPRIKSGEVDPTTVTEADALAMMFADPLLIRRPLIDVDGRKCCGFDVVVMDAWIGLSESAQTAGDVESCTRQHLNSPCPTV